MHYTKLKIHQAADRLEDTARGPEDNEAAMYLRKLWHAYEVAREVVKAKTHEHSRAAYAELVDLMNGKIE